MRIHEAFGWITTIAFAYSFLPQLVKTWKVKSVEDLSLWQYITLFVGYTSGMCYGYSLHEGPLMFGYTWGWLGCLCQLLLYWRYK